MNQNSELSVPHPQRASSARFSVRLCHGSPTTFTTDSAQALSSKKIRDPGCAISTVSPIEQVPTNSGESSGIKNWFDRSNSRPEFTLDKAFVDGDPPYFLHRQDSSIDESGPTCRPGRPRGQLVPGIVRAAVNDNGVDGYRSVIDDLTIENQKLKERLRKYEASYGSPHLEKDKLFEVKIHGLPSRKRRELEETLRAFAATINGPTNPVKMKVPSRLPRHHISIDASHNPSSSSTSNSRPVDSAYASISNSEPTSASASNRVGSKQKFGYQYKNSEEEKVQSFLHNIPRGLLPKHSTAMTDRQKKKAVVRRLEELFTGKNGVSIGANGQPQRQQEVSKSATRADRAADGISSMEGIREANILPYEMDIDASQSRMLADDTTQILLPRNALGDLASDDSPDTSSPDQRPTRPLDLDPDRAQIPSDNVEYIRHLGLSTPQFALQESADADADADGWIYLNLLVNMAQLHIINVTLDFVKSAVADVSEKFQLSRDGQKVRWRGGTEGTRLSSDSENSGSLNRSNGNESIDKSSRKKRKIDAGRFALAPIDIRDSKAPAGASQPDEFHYKPLFRHRGSSSEEFLSSDESDSPYDHGQAYENRSGMNSRVPRLQSRHSGSSSRSGKFGDNGPIVFYSGAQFYTDLSGDRGNISTPVHETGAGKDGYSNHTQDVLGCNPKRPYPLVRTTSGSNLSFRPFKDSSRVPDFMQTGETRSRTPELVTSDTIDMDFSPDWSTDLSHVDRPLLDFSASGLGGTQPADHFAATVETRRTILDSHTRSKLSKFSAPGPASRKFLHRIPKSFLNSFQDSKHSSSEIITSGLASLHAFRSPSPRARTSEELPVKIELVSAQFSRLEPSPLPAPSNYYAAGSSTDDDSDFSSSSSGVSHLHKDRHFLHRSPTTISDHMSNPQPINDPVKTEQEDNEDEDDMEVEDFDSSILEPENVAARENGFDMDPTVGVGSSAVNMNEESGCSSSESLTESDEDVEL